MSIKGFFPTGFQSMPGPYVQAYLILPRLDIEALINFLIDSGADETTLSLIDVERMSISYRRLRRSSMISVDGIAGEQTFYQEEAVIMMRDEEGKTYVFPINVDIPRKGTATQIDQQRSLPSLLGRDVTKLGRDVTNQCNLTINFQQGLVELIPPEGSRIPVPTRRLL